MKSNNWQIDVTKLIGPRAGKRPNDYLSDEIVESPASNRAVLAYSIIEVRMGFYKTEIALLANPSNPCLVADFRELECTYTRGSPKWLNDRYFVCQNYQYDRKQNKSYVHTVVIDSDNRCFSLLNDTNSFNFDVKIDTEGNVLTIANSDTNTDRTVPISDLSWQYAEHPTVENGG